MKHLGPAHPACAELAALLQGIRRKPGWSLTPGQAVRAAEDLGLLDTWSHRRRLQIGLGLSSGELRAYRSGNRP